MPDSPVALMIGLGIVVVVLLALGLVALRARRLGGMVVILEQKVVELRQRLRDMRTDLKVARARAVPPPAYADIIDQQISATRNYHLTLNAERDIVLDMAADAPIDRRAVSLRHAFLIAEKEAALAAESEAEIEWGVLESKLGQIIQFYEQAPLESEAFDPEESLQIRSSTDTEVDTLREMIENQERHIGNLERFKKLFIEIEAKWRLVSDEAEKYRQQFIEQRGSVDASNEFSELLEKYGQLYRDFGATLIGSEESARVDQGVEISADQPSVGRLVIANQEELLRLRNMAVDQHKMIQHLRHELESAQSVEQKDHVIKELHKQMERHERFLKESDQCIKQLEQELGGVHEENETLRLKLFQIKRDRSAAGGPDVEQMTGLIEDFTQQSSEMLNALEMLEAECSDLRQQLAEAQQPITGSAGNSHSATGDADELRRQLAAVQQELLNIQTQHFELEERYLELKSGSL